MRNKNKNGRPFTEVEKAAVWRKAKTVSGYNPAEVRKDTCGALMKWSEYGNTHSRYGWEIDHILPVSKGGGDDLANLQALQWENNRHKGDNFPNWSCKVAA